MRRGRAGPGRRRQREPLRPGPRAGRSGAVVSAYGGTWNWSLESCLSRCAPECSATTKGQLCFLSEPEFRVFAALFNISKIFSKCAMVSLLVGPSSCSVSSAGCVCTVRHGQTQCHKQTKAELCSPRAAGADLRSEVVSMLELI